MAQVITTRADRTATTVERPATYAHQAYEILHVIFTIAPIIAGIDKFTDVLVNWDKYLSPAYASISPLNVHTTMMAVGVVEIIAGLIVLLRPKVGAYLVTLWLWGIIVNLLLIPGYFDIALRDFGLSFGALALGRLSHEFDRPRTV